MISKYRRSVISLAVATATLGGVTWSPESQACSTEPYMASICIMTWPKNNSFGGSLYTAANGQLLQVNQYQALYSLIGNTYGGNRNQNNFALPDMRGRFPIGVGQGPGLPFINYGNTGGAASVTLSAAQLPSHVHSLSPTNAKTTTNMGSLTANTMIGTLAATTDIGTLAVNTSVGTLAVNTTIGSLQAVNDVSGLTATLNASSGGFAASSPANGALPSYTAPSKFYSSVAPSIAMATGSVTIGGAVTTTFNGAPASTLTGSPTSTLTGAPTTTLSGNPTTTLTGNLSVTLGGTTDATPTAGTTQPVVTLPPFTALVYYVATGGIYPTPD